MEGLGKLAASVLLLALGSVALAETPSVPRETDQIFLQTSQHYPIIPHAIAETADGGLIVAGATVGAAWATKTSASGAIQWTYEVAKPRGSYSNPRWLTEQPAFQCAVAMPDGTIWLAGETLGPGYVLSGLVGELDSQGRQKFRTVWQPPPRPGEIAFQTHLVDCTRWRKDAVVVGWTLSTEAAPIRRRSNGIRLPPPPKITYWILGFNQSGSRVFEYALPTALEGGIASLEVAPLQAGFVISAQTGQDTSEILRIGVDGALLARHSFASASLQLVRSATETDKIQLIGQVGLPGDYSWSGIGLSLLTLDRSLQVVDRRAGPKMFVAYRVYQLPDSSYVAFGSQVHRTGETYSSQMLHIGPMMQHWEALNPDRVSIVDAGMIAASVILQKQDSAVFVTVASVRGFPDRPEHNPAAPSFVRGAVVDFVNLR